MSTPAANILANTYVSTLLPARHAPRPQYNSFTQVDAYTLSAPTNINVERTPANTTGFPADLKFYDVLDGDRNSIPEDQVVVTYGEIGTFKVKFGREFAAAPNYYGVAFQDLLWTNSSNVTVPTNTTGTPEYTLNYIGNGATSGAAPANQTGPVGTAVTISAPGALAWPGYSFAGWNTQPGGNGTAYAAGSAAFIPQGGATLYAQWLLLAPLPIARNDAYTCTKGAPCTPGNVLANDSSPNGGAVLNATLQTSPAAGGNLTLNPGGTFTYVPPP